MTYNVEVGEQIVQRHIDQMLAAADSGIVETDTPLAVLPQFEPQEVEEPVTEIEQTVQIPARSEPIEDVTEDVNQDTYSRPERTHRLPKHFEDYDMNLNI